MFRETSFQIVHTFIHQNIILFLFDIWQLLPQAEEIENRGLSIVAQFVE